MYLTMMRFIVSRDVAFNELSTYYSIYNKRQDTQFIISNITTPELFSNEDGSIGAKIIPIPHAEDKHDDTLRRSTRQRNQPSHLFDYHVPMNQCTVTACFQMGDTKKLRILMNG